jgi:hypothetical protein
MKTHHPFNSEVRSILLQSGWYEGRKEGSTVPLPRDVTYPPKIKSILDEFGGLFIHSEGSGVNIGRSSIRFEPSRADGETIDGAVGHFAEMLGTTLYPLADLPTLPLTVCIDMNERIFLAGDSYHWVGDSFIEGISNILLGIDGKQFNEVTRDWWD